MATDNTPTDTPLPTAKPIEELENVVIRFAGDSGDGMQLTGSQFTNTTAFIGNDVSTLPDYPAEIRAPAGTLAGVSGFQLHFSSHDIRTPGDGLSVLVAMNPAALKANLEDLDHGGILVTNENAFTPGNLKKAGYEANPLDDDEAMKNYQLYKIPITNLTLTALEVVEGLKPKEAERAKNFFALGVMYWLYDRPMEMTLDWIESKFKKAPKIVEANRLALKSGYYFGETAEMFPTHYTVPKAALPPGKYRNITGNQAIALGCLAASKKANKPLLYATYPITPASDILHELSRFKRFGVMTIQAEDEIAAAGIAVGAAFAGGLAMTGTSGPGLALKAETLGLAVITELPMVIINVQRGGPSTGLPTKVEQSDLFQALYGRNGESPMPILAPDSPGDCFYMAVEAFRLAIKYMTPVTILSDGYLANGAEPWIVPSLDELADISVEYATDPATYVPYKRDPTTLARPWAPPGIPGLEHRIGGLEKQDGSGNVSYDPANHEAMTRIRAAKIEGIAQDIPDVTVSGPDKGELLIVGWGAACGSIQAATEHLQADGQSVACLRLRYIHPFPRNLEAVLKSYDNILVPELNLGQLAFLLRGKFLVNAISLSKIQGKPFKVSEIVEGAQKLLTQGTKVVESWEIQIKKAAP